MLGTSKKKRLVKHSTTIPVLLQKVYAANARCFKAKQTIYSIFHLVPGVKGAHENHYFRRAVLRVVLLRSGVVDPDVWEEPDWTAFASPVFPVSSLFLFGPRGGWLWVGTSDSSSSSRSSALGTTKCHWVPQLGQTLSPWSQSSQQMYEIHESLSTVKIRSIKINTLLLENNFLRQYLWIRTVQRSFWHSSACWKQTQKAMRFRSSNNEKFR